jgi:hypothetical protein
LLDPEDVLRRQIVIFIENGDFGLASGPKPDGSYERVWWKERAGPEEVAFDDKTFLLTRERAPALKGGGPQPIKGTEPPPARELVLEPPTYPPAGPTPPAAPSVPEIVRLALRGDVPPELWNKVGTKLIPKLRTSGQGLSLTLEASLDVPAKDLSHVESDLRQALRDLGLEGSVQIAKSWV